MACWRPYCAGKVGSAGNQREGGAAPPIEPAAYVDVERRVQGAVAEKADEQTVSNIKLPRRAERGDGEPNADHDGAEYDGPTHADSIGDPAHDNAPKADAEPRERSGERRRRARAVEVGGDRL
jgi:hypothetical protein